MNHELFDWDFENIAHIARHGVTPEEAEEVLLGDAIDLEIERRRDEERFGQIGITRQGRILQVFFTMRSGDRIRVVTSYAASAKLAKRYLLSRGGLI